MSREAASTCGIRVDEYDSARLGPNCAVKVTVDGEAAAELFGGGANAVKPPNTPARPDVMNLEAAAVPCRP
jgi:hypothetical protein